jgi:hypothetical protein
MKNWAKPRLKYRERALPKKAANGVIIQATYKKKGMTDNNTRAYTGYS